MTRVTVTCAKCAGTGRHAMPRQLLDVMNALRFGSRTAIELQSALRLKGASPQAALNNRLRKLQALGLVALVERDGRSYRWTLTPEGQRT